MLQTDNGECMVNKCMSYCRKRIKGLGRHGIRYCSGGCGLRRKNAQEREDIPVYILLYCQHYIYIYIKIIDRIGRFAIWKQ